MRCSELTAFGLAKRTRRSGSSEDHAVADARGVLELVVVLTERERALGDHAREAVEHRRGSGARARRGWRPSVGRVSRVTTATTAPVERTGMHCTCARSVDAEQRRVALDDLAGAQRRAPPAGAPPRRPPPDEVHRVERLAGRRAAPGRGPPTRLPSSPSTGASSSRSEKQRSASGCHDAASRCTWRSASPQSAVFVRACSKNVVTGTDRTRAPPCAKRHLADAREPARRRRCRPSKLGTLHDDLGRARGRARRCSSASRRATTS